MTEAHLTLCPDCLEFVCECPKPATAKRHRVQDERVLEVPGPDLAALNRSLPARPATKPSAGRGPTGRMRNFKAMADDKLLDVKQQLFLDGNDPLAVWRVNEELKRRGLPVT